MLQVDEIACRFDTVRIVAGLEPVQPEPDLGLEPVQLVVDRLTLRELPPAQILTDIRQANLGQVRDTRGNHLMQIVWTLVSAVVLRFCGPSRKLLDEERVSL